jgi:cytochrome c biogenesis protein CcmG, thiol:disulfide interchange protein DsbE
MKTFRWASWSVALVFFVGTSVASAEGEKIPLLQAGSQAYSNVVVLEKTVTDLFIKHAGGMANVKLKNLSPELQQQFGYDAVKAGEVERQQAAAKAAYQEQLRNAPPRPVARENPPVVQTPPEQVSAQPAAPPPSAPAPADPSKKKIYARSILNQSAPPLVIEKWISKSPAMEGKFLLIEFWSSQSNNSRRMIPILNEFHKRFGDRLVIIGISDEPEKALRDFKQIPIEYYYANDTQARMKKLLAVTGIPHVLIVDPEGIVRWEGFPFQENYLLTAAALEGVLSAK